MKTEEKKPLKKNDICVETFPVGMIANNCVIIYSVSTKKALIVDPGTDHNEVHTFLRTKGLTPETIIHTHAHFDHIGGASFLKEHYKVTLGLHKEDLPLYDHITEQGKMFGFNIETHHPIDFHLEDGEEIHWHEISFKIIHTPGHSPGSCCFYTTFFDRPFLISGDTLFRRSIGRSDLWGGDGSLLIKSIKEKLLSLPDDTYVIAGHGSATTIKEERESNPFLC